MREILISIRPKWCEKICHEIGKDENGKLIYDKQIEVRKSKPREVPFKAFIYMTATKERCNFWEYITAYQNSKGEILDGSQKIIGEFICDKIDDFYCASVPYQKENNLGYGQFIDNGVYQVNGNHEGVVFERNDRYIDSMLKNKDLEEMCLSAQEIFDYIGLGKHLFAWHISDLKIYDKPRELSEFAVADKEAIRQCEYREQSYYAFTDTGYIKNGFYCKKKDDWCFGECKRKALTRPPKSWCYVEVNNEK